MKVSELEGAELSLWVAKADGRKSAAVIRGVCYLNPASMAGGMKYDPHENWAHCGPLIEKYGISLDMRPSGKWDGIASKSDTGVKWVNYCDTPQQAICRAVVASVYGDEVDD